MPTVGFWPNWAEYRLGSSRPDADVQAQLTAVHIFVDGLATCGPEVRQDAASIHAPSALKEENSYEAGLQVCVARNHGNC